MSKGKGGLMAGLNAANERAATPRVRDVASRFDRAEETLGIEKAPALRTTRAPRPEKAMARAAATKGSAVRHDGFTLPLDEYGTIAKVQSRAAGAVTGHRSVSKSLVVRAGLAALDRMADDELVALLNSLPEIKTGAPKRAEEHLSTECL